MTSIRRLLPALLAMLLAGCGAAAPTSAGTAPVSPSPSVVATPSGLRPSEGFAVDQITLSDGQRHVDVPVFVADSFQLRRRGLMEREQLPADAGMLFVFDEPTDGGFWMKNTLIPLSIAFIGADRQVLEVADMVPCDADPCPVQRPKVEYRYALEVNRGFFDQHGITSGWMLREV